MVHNKKLIVSGAHRGLLGFWPECAMNGFAFEPGCPDVPGNYAIHPQRKDPLAARCAPLLWVSFSQPLSLNDATSTAGNQYYLRLIIFAILAEGCWREHLVKSKRLDLPPSLSYWPLVANNITADLLLALSTKERLLPRNLSFSQRQWVVLAVLAWGTYDPSLEAFWSRKRGP